MKIKNSRAGGLCLITAVYVLALAAGVAIYRALPYVWWLNLLLADVAATLLVFAFSILFKNASVYDPYWSVQPPIILLLLAWQQPLTLAGVLLLTAVFVWGIRLTGNWVYTFSGMDYQDWRYVQLREQSGKWYPFVNLMGIHMVPTLVVYGCLLPAAFVLREQAQANAGSYFFFLLSLGCVLLQGTADRQMHRFRKQGTGGLIREGVWKNARHPNYLAEIMMWWSVAGAAVSVLPFRWYYLAGAAANTALFLIVSIPMADRRQSRKEGYEVYRRETNMLLPLPKYRGRS